MAQDISFLRAHSRIFDYSRICFRYDGALNSGLKEMEKKKLINLNEEDLLRIEQIVIDRDREGALDFVKEVIKKQIDRENASKMKREGGIV